MYEWKFCWKLQLTDIVYETNVGNIWTKKRISIFKSWFWLSRISSNNILVCTRQTWKNGEPCEPSSWTFLSSPELKFYLKNYLLYHHWKRSPFLLHVWPHGNLWSYNTRRIFSYYEACHMKTETNGWYMVQNVKKKMFEKEVEMCQHSNKSFLVNL